jgi:hypothetical protein
MNYLSRRQDLLYPNPVDELQLAIEEINERESEL